MKLFLSYPDLLGDLQVNRTIEELRSWNTKVDNITILWKRYSRIQIDNLNPICRMFFKDWLIDYITSISYLAGNINVCQMYSNSYWHLSNKFQYICVKIFGVFFCENIVDQKAFYQLLSVYRFEILLEIIWI